MIYCVDLDGTLISNDMSVTSFFETILKKPQLIPACYRWHHEGGRARLKYNIGEIYNVNISRLKFNLELIDYLKELAENPDNSIYLVSGSTQSIVSKIASYFSFFKEGFGSSIDVNLTGKNKLALIKKYFGDSDVCYIGNARVDLKVWEGTHSGIVVSNCGSFISSAKKVTRIEKVFKGRFAHLNQEYISNKG